MDIGGIHRLCLISIYKMLILIKEKKKIIERFSKILSLSLSLSLFLLPPPSLSLSLK